MNIFKKLWYKIIGKKTLTQTLFDIENKIYVTEGLLENIKKYKRKIYVDIQ